MRKKWLIFLIIVILTISFSLLIEKQDLFKRAIVVGVAITEEMGKIEVSIEYMKENKYVVHTSVGTSFNSIIDNISKEIGLYVSLSQCVAIIIEKNQNMAAILTQLMKMQGFSTNSTIVSCEKPTEFLKSQVEAKESVSFLVDDVMKNHDQKTVLKDVLISSKTKKPTKIIGLEIKEKSLIIDNPYLLHFN